MSDNPPPVTKYEYTVTIHGNSHDEITSELLGLTRGGYLLDSDYEKRDEFQVIGGRRTSRLQHTNPEMTPERYERELQEWFDDHRTPTAPGPGVGTTGKGAA